MQMVVTSFCSAVSMMPWQCCCVHLDDLGAQFGGQFKIVDQVALGGHPVLSACSFLCLHVHDVPLEL
jgi:hypothetical protein